MGKAYLKKSSLIVSWVSMYIATSLYIECLLQIVINSFKIMRSVRNEDKYGWMDV